MGTGIGMKGIANMNKTPKYINSDILTNYALGCKIRYRMSHKSDKKQIRELVKERFGRRTSSEKRLKGRYLLAFVGDDLIAMTGILSPEDSKYKGYRIDRTCISKQFEGCGIIVNMIQYLIKDIHGKIFCNCLRTIEAGNIIHMHYTMQRLGFTEIIHNNEQWCSDYNCSHCDTEGCKRFKQGCKCFCDLYLLDKA